MSDRQNPRNRQRPAKAGRGRGQQGSLARPEPSVNMDELRELIALLRENGLAEFELEREGFRVRLRREIDFSGGAGQVEANSRQSVLPAQTNNSASPATSVVPAAAPATPLHPGASAESKASEDQDLHIIPSPIVGTFYRAASPNAEPFVKIGSQVGNDSVVCIIEAMKLMNEIQAETSGEVAKIYVENGQPVEYGQPLFGIKR
ncbi:MAG TPA: acetyl-CoA carboxylase biotin carboxyl carrier protein [Pyrinomonadaceae bacterium]|nr:acetyl-CoA carboxylase biotin carboxyl carrier protein [Pyrinomonadaceae bacterium]